MGAPILFVPSIPVTSAWSRLPEVVSATLVVSSLLLVVVVEVVMLVVSVLLEVGVVVVSAIVLVLEVLLSTVVLVLVTVLVTLASDASAMDWFVVESSLFSDSSSLKCLIHMIYGIKREKRSDKSGFYKYIQF